MTRIGRRLIEDFLLPALNKETYGDLLKWIDRDKGYFSIRWSHKNAAKWTLDDTAVFQDWDRLKGHYHPEIKGYYMQAKQRFRAALYKLNSICKLPCEDKHVKRYQLLFGDHKRHEFMPRKPRHYIKDENQKSIPTPVICRNTSFLSKATISSSEESLSSPPSSPANSVKSNDSDKMEEQECLKEYQLAQEKQFITQQIKLESCSDSMDGYSAILYDSTLMNVRRTPHVPIQPVPVYSKFAEANSQKRFESPHVLLVKTYNDSDSEGECSEAKKIKTEIPEAEFCNGKIKTEETEVKDSENTALNLSTKCDDAMLLSR